MDLQVINPSEIKTCQHLSSNLSSLFFFFKVYLMYIRENLADVHHLLVLFILHLCKPMSKDKCRKARVHLTSTCADCLCQGSDLSVVLHLGFGIQLGRK